MCYTPFRVDSILVAVVVVLTSSRIGTMIGITYLYCKIACSTLFDGRRKLDIFESFYQYYDLPPPIGKEGAVSLVGGDCAGTAPIGSTRISS